MFFYQLFYLLNKFIYIFFTVIIFFQMFAFSTYAAIIFFQFLLQKFYLYLAPNDI